MISVIDRPEVQEKLRDLVRFAEEQSHLSFDNLNEALPTHVNDPDELEAIIGWLARFESSFWAAEKKLSEKRRAEA